MDAKMDTKEATLHIAVALIGAALCFGAGMILGGAL